ncbi:hypothetical protein GCM10023238_04960 [Streptomyces heliomycini]
MKGRYLVDKSALAVRGKAAVRARLDVLDRDGLLAVCAPTEYEILLLGFAASRSAATAYPAPRLRLPALQ